MRERQVKYELLLLFNGVVKARGETYCVVFPHLIVCVLSRFTNKGHKNSAKSRQSMSFYNYTDTNILIEIFREESEHQIAYYKGLRKIMQNVIF